MYSSEPPTANGTVISTGMCAKPDFVPSCTQDSLGVEHVLDPGVALLLAKAFFVAAYAKSFLPQAVAHDSILRISLFL